MEIINLDNIVQLEDKKIYLFAEEFDENMIKTLQGTKIMGIISHKDEKMYGYKCFKIDKVFKESNTSFVIICQQNPINQQILNQFKMLNIQVFYFERIYMQYINVLKNICIRNSMEYLKSKKCDLCDNDEFKLVNEIGFDKEVVLTYSCSNCYNSFNYSQHIENEKSTLVIQKEKQKAINEYTKIKYLLGENKENIGFDFDKDNIKLLNVNSGYGYLLELINEQNENIFSCGIEPNQYKLNFSDPYDLRVENISIYDIQELKYYDVIVNFEGLLNCTNPKSFFESIYNHLEEDGVFVLGVPTVDKVKDKNELLRKDILNVFTLNTLRSYLESTGFQIIDLDINDEYTILAKKSMNKELKIYEDESLFKIFE